MPFAHSSLHKSQSTRARSPGLGLNAGSNMCVQCIDGVWWQVNTSQKLSIFLWRVLCLEWPTHSREFRRQTEVDLWSEALQASAWCVRAVRSVCGRVIFYDKLLRYTCKPKKSYTCLLFVGILHLSPVLCLTFLNILNGLFWLPYHQSFFFFFLFNC